VAADLSEWDTGGVVELPSGTVTFLFTDLEGSTHLWDEHPDAMRAASARHDELLRDAIGTHGGYVVKTTGDGFHAVFPSALDAVMAASDAQLRLRDEPWASTGPLRARMGLHTCQVELRDGDYYGSEVNRAARLMSVAHGGQVVVSETVEGLVRSALPADVDLLDLGEHRLRDLARAMRVFQLVHPALPREFPPLRSLDTLPGNLPVQVTSFVGRADEVERVAVELGETPVVTLTGVGGVGKTRLALEVAAEVVPRYRAGAWLVELAGVRDPESVPEAVASTFGLQPGSGLTATEMLLEFLRGKQLLLVLDNCEHLLRAVARLVTEVVHGCPDVRVLATSREGLNVAGERILVVASLVVPEDVTDLAAIASCDAVVLFVDRARAVKASFTLDDANAGAVAQVCRRLDGIALAIELAAARVAVLTPPELARRLDQRFRILAGGQRSAVERHQTLRAAIDWSYEMLSQPEQVLLARLSVFTGGFTLEATEAVTAGGAVDADDVFELLAALVSRSLVVADTEGVDARYRLLETIRQYAQEALDGSGDVEHLRREHGAYYAGFAEAAVAAATGPDGREWERRLAREYDNLRSALTWAAETGDVDTAVRLIAIWDGPLLLDDAGLTSASRWAADTVLAMPAAAAHPQYPSALVVAAMFAWAEADQARATRLCGDALEAEQRLGTDPSPGIWLVRCMIAMAEGRYRDASDDAQQGIALCRSRGDTARTAGLLAQHALTSAMQGDADQAARAAEEAVIALRGLPNLHGAQHTLAGTAFALGASQPERALAIAREAVTLTGPGERASAPWAIAGDLAARLGYRREALGYFARAADDARWLSMRLVQGTVLVRVATMLAEGDPEAAAVLLGAGDACAPGFAHAPHQIEAREHAIAAVDAAIGSARRDELYQQGQVSGDDAAVDLLLAAVARELTDAAA
jgi:predicted ATPase/class 3 adenylate cyclase